MKKKISISAIIITLIISTLSLSVLAKNETDEVKSIERFSLINNSILKEMQENADKIIERIEEEQRLEELRLEEEIKRLEEEQIRLENSKLVYSIPSNSGFKSYMGYTAITSTGSLQYQLQQVAYTGDYGIRQVDGRFCVAMGTYINAQIGQYVDLILSNGTVIPCVLGDVKSNAHTDGMNIFTSNGCCTEFIVDSSCLYAYAKQMGDVSYCNELWRSPVIEVHTYDKNVLF